MTDPIFYDATGRRKRRLKTALLCLLAALLVASISLVLALTRSQERAPIRFAEDATRPTRALATAPIQEPGAWRPVSSPMPSHGARQLFAFYMPWDDASRLALDTHVNEIAWLVPGLATIAGPDHRLRYEPDPGLRAVLAGARHRPHLLPMVQNAAPDGSWDGAGIARLLAEPAARARLIDSVFDMVAAEAGQGVMLDFESLPAPAHVDYRTFLADLRARFAPRGWLVTLAVPVADPSWDLAAYARVADRVVLMAYDEHWMGGTAGPIASQPWFARVVADAVARVGRDKAVVALGNYAYDWSEGRTEPLTVAAAWARAEEAGAVPVFDPASGNAHFAYRANGRDHQVWLLDALSAANQQRVIDELGVAQTALWRLGSEDPGFWAAYRGDQAGLRELPALPGVTVRGTGEVMRLDAQAAPGQREVHLAPDGLIHDARYERLPTADTVQRTGARCRLVA